MPRKPRSGYRDGRPGVDGDALLMALSVYWRAVDQGYARSAAFQKKSGKKLALDVALDVVKRNFPNGRRLSMAVLRKHIVPVRRRDGTMRPQGCEVERDATGKILWVGLSRAGRPKPEMVLVDEPPIPFSQAAHDLGLYQFKGYKLKQP